jgi:DNA-binding response OmpR family regulator
MADLVQQLLQAGRGQDRRVGAAYTAAGTAVAAARARLGCDILLVDSEAAAPPAAVVAVNGLVVDRARRTVTRDDEPVPMAPTMFEMLWLLAGDPTRVFSKNEVYKAVWKTEHLPAGATRTVDAHLARLRGALGGRPWVHTHWGVGVSLVPPGVRAA